MATMKTGAIPAVLPEWSHKIPVGDIGAAPLRTVISASPQQRKDLARRLRVESVESAEATLDLQRDPATLVLHVAGVLRARVVQPCVITREPVEEAIETPVEGWFADPDRVVSLLKARRERSKEMTDGELPMLEEKDDPEPVIDGAVDLGELVAQYLSLAVNPYPHREGAVFEEGAVAAAEGAAVPPLRRSPFAALRKLKKS